MPFDDFELADAKVDCFELADKIRKMLRGIVSNIESGDFERIVNSCREVKDVQRITESLHQNFDALLDLVYKEKRDAV